MNKHSLVLRKDYEVTRWTMGALDGILLLNKPKGLTSHDCVVKIRKLLNEKKVGHTGTLDPNASGILPICIGRATKVAEYMANYPKTYEATISLGAATTTEDCSGDIIEEKKIESPIRLELLKSVLEDMQGTITQVPPMYSAVKVDGKRLYKYALEGKTVQRPARKVKIYRIELLTNHEIDSQQRSFSIRVACSKGTYVRTLAVDIGKKLGYPAHLAELIRTKSGPFALEHAVTFQEIQEAASNGKIEKILHPIDKAVSHFEKKIVPDHLAAKIENGAVIPQVGRMENKRYAIYNADGELLAIYIPHPKKPGFIKPEKMIKVKKN